MSNTNKDQLTLFSVGNHSNLGLAFERDLENVHHWYRMQGWADVRKIQSSWTFISEKEYQGLMSLVARKAYDPGMLAVCANQRKMKRIKSDVDFVGGGGGGGKQNFSIAFDAKTCSGNTFALSLIEPHQMEFLRQRHRCKITSGVMVLMAQFNRVFFVPFAYLDKRQSALQMQTGKRAKPGTASLSMSDFEANAIEITKHKINMLWDWLPRLVTS